MADQGIGGGDEALATNVPKAAPTPVPTNTSLELWKNFFSTYQMKGDLATEVLCFEAEASLPGVWKLDRLLYALYDDPYSPCPSDTSTCFLEEFLKLKPLKGREFAVVAREDMGDTWMVKIANGSENRPDYEDEVLQFRLDKSACKDQPAATKISRAICKIADRWPRPIGKVDSRAGAFDRQFMLRAVLKHVDPHRILSLDIPEVCYEAATSDTAECYGIKTTLETRSHGAIEFLINAAPEEVDLDTPVPKLAEGARLRRSVESMIPTHIQPGMRARHRRAIEICNYAVCMVHGRVFDDVNNARAFLEELTSPFKNTYTSRRRRVGKQPLFRNTSSAADRLTRGEWNATIVNDMTDGGLDGVKPPDIIVNSAARARWIPVSNKVRGAFEQGRPIREVMLASAKSADIINGMIADGEPAMNHDCCSEEERLRMLHCCPLCTVQTLCSSMRVREDLGLSVCQYCHRNMSFSGHRGRA